MALHGTSGSLHDVISRLDSIIGPSLSEGTVTLESYKYLGLSTVVERDEGDGVNLTYIGTPDSAGTGAGDPYAGLDRFGRVVDQKWTTGVGGGAGTVMDEYLYTYDRDSNVTAKVNTNQTANNETYTYDTLAQLTAVSRGGGAYQSFGVDSLGNIGSVTTGGTEQDRTSNSENQLTAVGSTALAYDANGNLTTDDQGRTLVYDAWNRLLAVMDGGVMVVSYGYDGLGRLITETDASGTRTDTYFSGTQDIETRVDGAVAAENVFSPVYVNAILLRDAGSERVYFTADANYNVTGVVGTSGTMLQRQVYDAYGNVTFTDASWNPLTADGQGLTHLYQGMLYAPEIGWYFSGQSNFARWYSPGLMIWTRGDTGYIDSMDLYEPFAANPINYLDPTGTSIVMKCNIDDYLDENNVHNFNKGQGNEKDIVYRGDATGRNNGNVVPEILASMIRSKRVFYVKDGSLDNLKLHVKAREAIVELAHDRFNLGTIDRNANPPINTQVLNDKMWFNLESGPNAGTLAVKVGQSAFDALDDINTNGSAYSIGCFNAALVTMLGGIANALGKGTFNSLSQSVQSTDRWALVFGKRDRNVDDDDWIPGDWGYIASKGHASSNLMSGENIIYVGYSLWWGHPGGTHSLDTWLNDVASWNGNAGSTLGNFRDRPTVGLSS